MKFTPDMMTGLRAVLTAFMLKMFKNIRVRYILVLPLVILFIWWGSNAVLRFWSQPLTTDISHKFGDTRNGIQFPLVTFCPNNFPAIMNNCRDKFHPNFIPSFALCLKNDPNFNIDNFLESLKTDITSIVEKVRLFTGSEYTDIGFWSSVFHFVFGECFTFDMSKTDEFRFVQYNIGHRPGIEFMLAENNPLKQLYVILHSKKDLPDAYILNGINRISFSNETKEVHKFDVRKKITKRESTREVPCEHYEYKTCKDIEDNELVLSQFNCRIPILYSGHHLDDIFRKDILNCSNQVIKEAFDLLLSKESKCTRTQTCEMTRFPSTYKVERSWIENKTLLFVAYENPEVEYHHTYISYDLLSLIGELGGILGLTLGASVLTLLESIIQRVLFIKI